jgi:hypothetical protein
LVCLSGKHTTTWQIMCLLTHTLQFICAHVYISNYQSPFTHLTRSLRGLHRRGRAGPDQ